MSSRKLFRTSIISIGLKGVGAGLLILVSAVLARVLGAEGFGVYAYVLAILTILALPIQSGLPQLVTRETAKGVASGDLGKVIGMWRWAQKAVICIGGALLVLLLVIYTTNKELLGNHHQVFLAGTIIPLMLAFSQIRAAALRGLKMVIYALFADTVLKPFVFLLLIFLTLESQGLLTPARAMVLHAIALSIAFIFGAIVLYKKKPWNRYQNYTVSSDGGLWLKALVPLSMAQGLRMVNAQASLIILGVLALPIEVGVYKAMLVFAASLVLPLEAINGVISPYLAAQYQQGKKQELEALVLKAAISSFLLVLGPAICFVLFGRELIGLVYGLEYDSGYAALLIMLIGQIVNAAVGPVALLLNMTGYERYTMRGVGISTLVNITLNLILIPKYGMIGAAVATAASTIIWNAILWYFAMKVLKVNSSIVNIRLFKSGT